MAKNSNLHNAKVAKNDDFFTQLSDIENELQHYWSHGINHFEGKSVLMNCDNPKFSNFWVYFHKNFNKLKLTRIGAIHYSTSEPAYYKEYTGGDDFDITVGNETLLRGNGDFRSEECIEILKGYDMVVTNPPFSLFRDFITQLMEYNKEFIIIGNRNALTYKEIFPLIKDNKMWLGVGFNAGNAYFKVSPDTDVSQFAKGVYNTENQTVKFRNCVWYTNIDLEKRHEWIPVAIEYNSTIHPKYDNYDAINVDKMKEIPIDYFESYVIDIENKSRLTDYHIYDDIYEFLDAVKYKELPSDKIAIEHNGKLIIPVVKDNANEVNASLILKGITGAEYRNGVMGVPITFLDKYCPEQFEILDLNPHFFSMVAQGLPKPKQLSLKSVGKKDPYARVLVKLRIYREDTRIDKIKDDINRLKDSVQNIVNITTNI